MTDTGDLDSVLVFEFEEEAVVAAAESKLGAGRLEFLEVTSPTG